MPTETPQFNPHDERYRSLDDLPPEAHNYFVISTDGQGFILKEAQTTFESAKLSLSEDEPMNVLRDEALYENARIRAERAKFDIRVQDSQLIVGPSGYDHRGWKRTESEFTTPITGTIKGDLVELGRVTESRRAKGERPVFSYYGTLNGVELIPHQAKTLFEGYYDAALFRTNGTLPSVNAYPQLRAKEMRLYEEIQKEIEASTLRDSQLEIQARVDYLLDPNQRPEEPVVSEGVT